MKIAYTLEPTKTAADAVALLLPSRDAADLFELLERLGLDALPSVFAVAEGFLIRLPRPREAAIAGVVRLRALATNLYLPVDAELSPPLLDDEAQGLTSRRGLVFLPGSRVLEFAPDRPLAWTTLLETAPMSTGEWSSLPESPALADSLVELSSSVPPPTADAILEQGREDIGTQSPAPEGARNVGAQILGTSLFVTGHMMTWLGMKLGLSGIAAKGADMLQGALDRVPRLSKFLMDQQEAMLRRLLKDFHEGRIEEALRRALPLGAPPSQAMTPAMSANLPWHSFLHSLDNLIGRRPGPAGAWFTPDDIYRSLQAEYCKQAEEASRHGDFRRAAFIYAKLLYDLHAAAHILSQGGLHRDAATIFEKALNNPRTAAKEWEAAGEIDRAVEIYVNLSDSLAAAELLQRVGEEARALVHFHDAAQKLIVARKFFEAGELMRTKARRPELALALFRDGWKTRPDLAAIACGIALAENHAAEPNAPRLRQLVREAETCAATWPLETVKRFFDTMVRCANRPAMSSVADEVHDHCLLTLAAKMAETRKADAVFGADSPWPGPVVRDARFAMDHRSAPVSKRAATPLVRIGQSIVRAVCRMRISGDLFLGFDDGTVAHHRPATGETRILATHSGPILGLQVDASERHLIVISRTAAGVVDILVGSRYTRFDLRSVAGIRKAWPISLLATVDNRLSPYFGFLHDGIVDLFRTDNPSWRRTIEPTTGSSARSGVIVSSETSLWLILFMNEGQAALHSIRTDETETGPSEASVRTDCDSLPEIGLRSTLLQASLFARCSGRGEINIEWITREGRIGGMILEEEAHRSMPELVRLSWPTNDAAFPLPGCFESGVTSADREVLWARLHRERTLGRLVNPVAAFVQKGDTFLVIEADGTLHSLPRK